MMMAASDHKEDGREEKKEPLNVTEEGSKPNSTSGVPLHMAGTTSSKKEHRQRAYCTLIVLNIILFVVVVVAVLCGAGAFVYMFQRIDSLQKQVNDSVHSCAQLNEDSIQTPCLHLQQNVSMLYDDIHELYSVRDELYTKISVSELNVSQLNTNSTSVQLINLAFALSELQRDLDSTTRNFLTTKSALEVNISQLNARANSTDMQLENLANGTDAQLRDLTSALNEMRHNLTSTRQELLASKSAIDLLNARANSADMQLANLTVRANSTDMQLANLTVRANSADMQLANLTVRANSTDMQLANLTATLDEARDGLQQTISLLRAELTVRANSTELHLRNITSTLSELRDGIKDNQHQLKNLSLMHEEHEHKIHQITLNILRFHENVSLSQEIHAREVNTLQFNVSSLNSQISTNDDRIQGLSNEQSRVNARMSEIEAKVNSASTLSTTSPYIVLLSTFLCCLCN